MNKKNVFFKFVPALLLAVLCLPLAAQDNPFLSPYKTPFQTPPFDRIQIGHYLPAVQEGIKRQQAEIDAIVANPKAADVREHHRGPGHVRATARRSERRLLLPAERGHQPADAGPGQ